LLAAGVVVDRVLPEPFARWLSGAGFSVGLLAFVVLSTAVLWNVPLPAPGSAAIAKTTTMRR
jgi:hypothetical protein